MLDPATARLCVCSLPLDAAFRLFSKLGSLGGSIRERFSRTGRTRPALARPAFSRWLLENDRLRERWPCQWLNVLYFPFSETSPVYKAQSQLCVALLGCLVIGGRMSPVSLKLPHAPCAPYHLITFKCSCRASLWPLAEPFQPKLGLSLYERLMPIFTPSRIIPN